MKNLMVLTVAVFCLSLNIFAEEKAEKQIVAISVNEAQLNNFIAAYPDLRKEATEAKLDVTNPATIANLMNLAAADKAKWDAFATAKGFTDSQEFFQVLSGTGAAFVYNYYQQSMVQAEKQMKAMPGVEEMLKKQLKPAQEKAEEAKKAVTPETLELVKSHMKELSTLFIGSQQNKSKKTK